MSERPTPPEDWECCESECSPCVWDTYYEELREWNAEQKAMKSATAEANEGAADVNKSDEKSQR
ncbi:oxidoreductase-like domain-containing protein [Marinomonas pollencensis]|uniref:Oxidoreductase family protein n=1 Tax=Marinomonas pollencensis TaxID=491954 RepID=A0A3E0DMW4_9GAMM|nr:oxidoreductase-like domain-containing protein [Marinomonas pollencensis]REG84216.1 oxidoreductase family protein [Marinomonas pollencensis]